MASFIKAIEVVKGGFVRPGPVDTQFDPLQLSSFTDIAEEKYVQPILGADFFQQLKDERTPNTINYNVNLGAVQVAFADADLEQLFKDKGLFRLIALAVIYEALPYVHFQISSTGVQSRSDAYSRAADGNEMRFLLDRLRRDIEFLQQQVKDFLCANSTTYEPFDFNPELICPKCNNKKNGGLSSAPLIY